MLCIFKTASVHFGDVTVMQCNNLPRTFAAYTTTLLAQAIRVLNLACLQDMSVPLVTYLKVRLPNMLCD